MPDFKFYKCDGDRAANAADFKEAGFNSGTYLFSRISPEGIGAWRFKFQRLLSWLSQWSTPSIRTPRLCTATLSMLVLEYFRAVMLYLGPSMLWLMKMMWKYVLLSELNWSTYFSQEFTDEDTFWDLMDGNERPVFVKFYEKWCAHCQRLKKVACPMLMFNGLNNFETDVHTSSDFLQEPVCFQRFPISLLSICSLESISLRWSAARTQTPLRSAPSTRSKVIQCSCCLLVRHLHQPAT